MISSVTTINDVKTYIAQFPPATQKLLKQMQSTIKKAAPDAEETISYKMPAYKYFGMLVYFAGYDHHLGFYPGASGIFNFKKDIAVYKNAKGSVQFPLDAPLPVKLIAEIVTFRMQENLKKQQMQKKPLKK